MLRPVAEVLYEAMQSKTLSVPISAGHQTKTVILSLPDVTVISPVFTAADESRPTFFVANRGHHADIGGIVPGSMPPFSRSIDEEGVRLHDVLVTIREPAGKSPLLRATGEATGDSGDGIRFLESSPLARRLRHFEISPPRSGRVGGSVS